MRSPNILSCVMRRRKGRGRGRLPLCCCTLLSCLAWGSAPPASQPPGTGRGGPPPQPFTIPKPVLSAPNPCARATACDRSYCPTRLSTWQSKPGDERTPPSCRVTATVTHPPAGDRINVFIGLPLKLERTVSGCRRRRLLRRERKRHSAAALRRLRRRCDRHRPRGWEWKLRARCERPSELARGQGQCVSRHP